MERLTRCVCGIGVLESWALHKDPLFIVNRLCDALCKYDDIGLSPEDFKKAFNEDAILKLAAQALGTTPDHLRDLIRAEKDEALLEQKVCSSCYHDSDHSHCPDGVDSLLCGLECFGCACGECEGGSNFKPKEELSGKDSAAPGASGEPAEPEWKGRVMRTFLGGR